MKEVIELCETYCPSDCVYRTTIEGGSVPICYYAAVEHQLRGCRISECDKYIGGQPKKATMDRDYMLFWEYEFYDTIDNLIW